MAIKPLLIVLTGINGSGKGTLGEKTAQWLQAETGLPARCIYAPQATPIAAAFQAAVFMKPGSDLAELLGYYAQHAESDQYIAGLRSERPQHLVVDRGPETTLAYNAMAKDLPPAQQRLARELYVQIRQILQPDLTILLDIDASTARKRSAQQATSDHIQDRNDAYYERVIRAYGQLAGTLPGWATVDARASIDENFKRVIACIEPLLQNK
jgi:thymidylate kinase